MSPQATFTAPVESRISDREFDAVRRLVYENFGISLSSQKKTLVVGRLQKVLRLRGFSTFADYLKWVQGDPSGEALSELADRISTNHTYFNREHEHFDYFAGTVLPEAVKRRTAAGDAELRVWCAGCSTGEEPYTLMMLMVDALAAAGARLKPVLLATDISMKALQKAQAAVYPQEAVSKLPPALKNRYLLKQPDGQFRVADPVRTLVHFRRHNLMNRVFRFRSRFDAIFCRNVMIYFDNPTRSKLVEKFADNTVPGGYLFIGHSETISRDGVRYRYVLPACYRKPF